MWFRNTSLVLALFGGVVPSVLTAQTSPREAATEFLDAWNARRWADAARLLDLDQFDRFRQDFITRTRRAAGQRPTMTVEDLRRSDPDMPREVAEYQIRQMEDQQRRFADPTAYEFARVSSTSALRALGPEEAAARWLESRDPRWQVRMQFEQAGCPAPDDIETIPTARRRLIGVVTEPGAGTYALYREERAADEAPDWAGGDLFVMELKQVRGRWAVVPRADLLPEVGNVDVGDCRRR